MTINRPHFQVRTKQVVVAKCVTDPIVGFEHLASIPDGWQYDIKRWSSYFDLKLPELPRLTDSDPQGVKASEYFLPGVGDKSLGDLELFDIDELFENTERHWIPIIKSGEYFHYNIPFYYFSDDSHVQYPITADNLDNRNVLLLETEPNQRTPITAASYRRNKETGEVTYYEKVEQKYKFSGTYTDGVENETITSLGKILWDNVDFNKKEFIIDQNISEETTLRFNKDYINSYGVTPQTYQDLAACEVLGMSNGSTYQVYYLKNFPVITSTFKLYVVSGLEWEEWTRVATWFDLVNETGQYGQNRYFLDRDLGIVYFASAQENSAPQLGQYIVCQYSTTLRVEYEEANDDLLITAWDADVSPVSQYINQGFVCITHQTLEPAYIKLSIDKLPIAFTSSPRLYGPITVGSDFGLLKATVTSYSGIPIPGTEVIFSMEPNDIGYLDGADSSTAVTNGSGEAFTSYQPPVSADDLGYYITNEVGKDPKVRASTHPSYTAHKELIVADLNADLINQEEELYIYQIVKDDLLQGYDNVDSWIDANMTPPAWAVPTGTITGVTNAGGGKVTILAANNGRSEGDTVTITSTTSYNGVYVISNVDAGNSFEITAGYVASETGAWTYDDTERWRREVAEEYELKDWDEINTTSGVQSDGTISGRKIVIYTTDSALHDNQKEATGNYDATAINPITGETGAIVPVRPLLVDRIDDNTDPYNGYLRLIYPEDTIPDPEPTNSSNNVGGYWIVSTKLLTFQAYCWSPRYNRNIYSNNITAKISLPQYLLGEYINEQLRKVPFGWKLISDTDNYAAGLNGATFITINPTSGPYQILDLVTGTITTDWASAPFKSLAFQVTPGP